VAERVRVKICGLTRNEDARVACSAGADFLGLVLTPGFGRSVALDRAPGVIDGVEAERVAVTVDEHPETIEAAAGRIGASVIQLHGAEGRSLIEELRRRGPWRLWKAVRARRIEDVVETVDTLGDLVDGVLVEGWSTGVIGGGGIRVGLDTKGVRGAIPEGLAFVLAGGLAPGRVGEAVARFSPDVVDVSSGVEESVGIKSAALVESFIRAARRTSPVDTNREPSST